MIDYRDIGNRIRSVRTQKHITQSQLADAVGVGTTHISHIETGNTIPSLETLIGIINALDCSADELLCLEVKAAKPLYEEWLSQTLSDCTGAEMRVIAENALALKKSLRKHYPDED